MKLQNKYLQFAPALHSGRQQFGPDGSLVPSEYMSAELFFIGSDRPPPSIAVVSDATDPAHFRGPG